ncbi:hypothetical protein [Streptomyces sp. IBSBF 3010]
MLIAPAVNGTSTGIVATLYGKRPGLTPQVPDPRDQDTEASPS